MWMNATEGTCRSDAASFERPIDLVHLARQTLGDRDLEQEILNLYFKQAQSLLSSIEHSATMRERNDFAHALKGSSRAVGAWQVASAAEAVEIAPPNASADSERVIAALRVCVRAACDTIAALQRPH